MSELEKIIQHEECAERNKTPSLSRRIYELGSQYIDYKLGGLGAGLMGAIVAYINSDHGFLPATTAALKQAAYTFFFGGFVMKTCESLATKIKNKTLAKILSVVVPSVITIGATYFIHNIRGTPKPFESTIPTMILAPPSFIYWGNRKRKQSENYSATSKNTNIASS